MSNSVFPTLVGLGWPVTKTPHFATSVQTSVAFDEVRGSFAPYPQWRWRLPYNFLRADANVEYQTLVNFFLARYGRWDSFLYSDPSDNTVTDQIFGTGDGVTTAFQLLRTLAALGFAEYIYNLNGLVTIKKNGVVQTGGVDYHIANGLVTFTVAPAGAASLTWTGSYYWRVRFDMDATDFEQFVYQFWHNREIAFVSVLGS